MSVRMFTGTPPSPVWPGAAIPSSSQQVMAPIMP
jgi:hypothetical protein